MGSNNKGGRPLKPIDQKIFENLCGLQCTQEEICGWFDCDDVTLNSWCKRTYNISFSEVFKQKRGNGKISLRRMQWRLAEKSPAMAIFLGKNFLAQTDKTDVTVNGSIEDVTPIASMFAVPVPKDVAENGDNER